MLSDIFKTKKALEQLGVEKRLSDIESKQIWTVKGVRSVNGENPDDQGNVTITAGVTDHGTLTGLADDDHTQYHTDARALTWLGTRSTTDLAEGTNLYYTDERVDDRVSSLLTEGSNITLTYDDAAGTLTIAATGGASPGGSANYVQYNDGSSGLAGESDFQYDPTHNAIGMGIAAPDATYRLFVKSDATNRGGIKITGFEGLAAQNLLQIDNISGNVTNTYFSFNGYGQFFVRKGGASQPVPTGGDEGFGIFSASELGLVATAGNSANVQWLMGKTSGAYANGRVRYANATETLYLYTNSSPGLIISSGQKVLIDAGALGTTSPGARLHVVDNTMEDFVLNLQSWNTGGDEPTEKTWQGYVKTTDATVTNIRALVLPSDTSALIEAHIIARRTGGTGGTAQDTAGYVIRAVYKSVSGNATKLNETIVYESEDQAGWTVSFTQSSNIIFLQVTGAANNNISWAVTGRIYPLSS